MVASGPGRGSGTSTGWPTPGCGWEGGGAAAATRAWSSLLPVKLIGGTCGSAVAAGAAGGAASVLSSRGAAGATVGGALSVTVVGAPFAAGAEARAIDPVR